MIRTARLSALTLLAAALAVALPLFVPAVIAEDDARLRVAVIDFDTEALQASWRYSWHWSNLSKTAAANLAE